MMIVYETNLGNFGTPKDLMRYMLEEGINKVHITAKFCGEPIGIEGFECPSKKLKSGWRGSYDQGIY